jgi:NADP-dependent 3-hydroxy acid dehydrogenase YdfG
LGVERLATQVVVVFGASSGIGLETARAFAGAGAAVVLAARRGEVVKEEAQRLVANGGRAHAVSVDVRSRASVDQAIASALAQFGRIDVLVNAAGTNVRNRALSDLDEATYGKLIETNLTGAYNTIQAVVPTMRTQGGGLIIQIGSVSGRFGDHSGVAYQASKHGIKGLCYGLVAEEHRHGIRATVIEPGLVDTPLLLQRPVFPAADVLAQALQPEDVAQVCLLVASLPARAYIPDLTLLPAMLQYVGRTDG